MEFKVLQYQQNFLERLDLFGIGINIRFNKQASHKTKIGGLVTVCLLGILGYQIKLILDQLYDYTHPYVLQEQKFTAEPQRYNLTSDKFILTFGLQNSTSQHYIDPTVYNATLTIKQTIKTKNEATGQFVASTIIRTVKTEPCRIDHFNIPEVNNYFISLSYQNMYCISKEETDLYFQGQFDAQHYSAFELKVSSCTGSNCNPNMNQLLQYCRLAIYYADYSVIPSDKAKPFQPLGKQSFWVSGPDFTKVTTVSFRNTYLNSDYGLVGTDIQTTNALTLSSEREQVTPKTGNLLFDCYIQLDRNVDNVYNRSYQKLDKSLSQLGGIFNILFTVGALICRPLSQIELDLKLINRLFNFEEPTNESDKKKQDQNKSSQENDKKEEMYTQAADQILITKEDQQKTSFKFELQKSINQKSQGSSEQKSNGEEQNIQQSRILQKFERVNQTVMRGTYNQKIKNLKIEENKESSKKSKKDIEQEAKKLYSFFSFSKNKISFQGWDYCANFFKFSKICKRRRYELLQKGVDKLYNQIDIFYLVQKLLEVEKLKRLLLNENQIKLFEFIPKPVLTLDEKKSDYLQDKIGLLNDCEKDVTQKTSEVQDAFQQIINSKTKPSKIDIRILELLDPQFKQFLSDLANLQGESTKLRQTPILDAQQKSIFEKQDFILDDLQVPIEEYSSQQKSLYFNVTPSKTLGSIYQSQKKEELSNMYPF
ncbi:hypothetical protein TTHERM_000109335 (macronuclear) [Tetrahymena thermophila SB210]|uniref:Uncharacterized protein n=1 Tax=Tetrahymena thermophila (strain SB210) TaxID=312017 RepID=W7XDT6_TETTS|nr:hypothetical protein TTHERM_000109335 [Tetrahymena thermophila SB210]EWS75762.1 hypothetical protein TTHERM_000109335 [Tetrahymena thermophila SB210]|eukprot:XP_012651684.1 hypothetical protein TTHERM_000109335 [Tetrahymena thermophila SB210]